MNTKQALKIYKKQIEKIKAYTLVLDTTSFDRLTIAPKDGSIYRNKMISIINGELFELQTDKEFVEAVLYLSSQDLGEVMNREIALAKKAMEDQLKFTKEEAMTFSMALMEGNDAWRKAKSASKYALFEKQLLKLIDLSKQRAAKRDPKKKAYDLLLDDYEEGMNQKKYDEFFKLIKTELLPLIKKIDRKKNYIDNSFLYKYYPAEKQAIFMEKIMKYLNFDPSWGYMGLTEHPFTNGLSRNDVRVTTHYYEHDISAAIFSLVHECGHAFYEHQVDPKFDNYLYIKQMSSGIHESQSRFFENYLARRESFFALLYPELQKLFPENLKDVTLEQFVKAVNVSHCSLIRTRADELTYPIHILIRYELEKDIFAGKADLKNLDKEWNKKYKKYLGVEVKKDSEGILQDVHWSDASFGYFPTYALGSAIGAQIFKKMSEDLDVDKLLSTGKFKVITDYLKKNIQKYAALYNYETILKMASGEDFNPRYYIDYLKEKYQKLYDID